MKPDTRYCLNCNKEISNKARFCSPKCKMAFRRNKPTVTKDENVTPNVTVEPSSVTKSNKFRDSLTKTDKTFYDRAMRDFNEPYYKFGEHLKEVKCDYCNKTFKSSLALLRYCCYEHYVAVLKPSKKANESQ